MTEPERAVRVLLMSTQVCVADNCRRTDIKARDLCGTHYDRWYVGQQRGTPVAPRVSFGASKCQAEECDQPASVRSDGRITCRMHEARYQRHGSYDKKPAGAPKRGISYKGICSIVGCNVEARSKASGLCEKHYHRQRKHGDPLITKRRVAEDMTVDSLLANTEAGTSENGTQDCQLWSGRIDKEGYGYEYDAALHRAGKQGTVYVHRRIYELIYGTESIEGLTIDHRCHDPNRCSRGPQCPHRRCINPEHLVPETRAMNARRHSPIQRELAFADTDDPGKAAEFIRARMFKPCGHLYPKYGPTCTCDQKEKSA